jgi:hypothetical protein
MTMNRIGMPPGIGIGFLSMRRTSRPEIDSNEARVVQQLGDSLVDLGGPGHQLLALGHEYTIRKRTSDAGHPQ